MEKLTDVQKNNMNRLLKNVSIIELVQNLLEQNGVTDIVVKSITLRPKILNTANAVVYSAADATPTFNPCKPGYRLEEVCEGNSCRKKCVKIST